MTYGQTESTVNLYFSLVDQVENYKFSLAQNVLLCTGNM